MNRKNCHNRLFRCTIAAVSFLLLNGTPTFADPAKDFEKLETQMETAFDTYVEALAKKGETEVRKDAGVHDGRPDVLKKMDAFVLANLDRPAGAEPAVKTFIWSAMFEIDAAVLQDRFSRVAQHFATYDGVDEVVAMVPDVYHLSEKPADWIRGLTAIENATPQKSIKVAAAVAIGRLSMENEKNAEAIKAFRRAVKLDPDSEQGALAKGYAYEIEHLQIGMVAPDFTTTTITGNKVSLKDLRGKVVLLDFWATWCGPCLGEIPHIKKAVKHFEGKPFEILAVSLDDMVEMLEATVKQRKLPGVQTWEEDGRENEVANLYNAQVLPTWFLIDAKGVIRAKDTFGDSLIPAVEVLLKTQ